MPNYWKVKMSYDGDYKIGKDRGFVGICWGKLNEDLSWIIKRSEETARSKLKERLHAVYGKLDNKICGRWSGEIINFVKMEKNDIVLTPSKAVGQILIGKILDKYKFDNKCVDGSNCQHKQSVKWIRQIKRENISLPLVKALNQQGTVTSLDDYAEEIGYIMQFGKKFELPKLKIGKISKVKCADIIKRILYMNEFDFEEYVANILELWLGWKTEVTGKRQDDGLRGDGGIDIQCAFLNPTRNGLKRYTFFADVQCKRMKNPIGLKDIKKFSARAARTLCASAHR